MRRLRLLALLPFVALMGGCGPVVLNPSGDIAAQQRDLLVDSVFLMLLIVIPVMITVVVFAWRYRASNKDAAYSPEWDHSTQLEVLIWSAPLLIVICLGALTWLGTHLLDPYRSLGRVSPEKPIAANETPLEVDVVALDWKWLFIYPQYGIATVNEMAAPVDRPIAFKLTASSVMNAFYVPALAGMIYAMPAMQSQLNAVINQAGTYEGISANYSGAGFSGMHFAFKGLTPDDFDKWIATAKAAGGNLDRPTYLTLEKPTENEPVKYFGGVDPQLFKAVLELCVEPSKMCSSQVAAIDAKGGMGLAGIHNVTTVADNRLPGGGAPASTDRTYVATLCDNRDGGFGETHAPLTVPAEFVPLAGAGLRPPGPAAASTVAEVSSAPTASHS